MTRVLVSLACLFPVLCRADTFVVTNTLGMGDGSFRWAVNQSNEFTGADTILFAIPERDPGHDPARGVWTIAMDDDFPNNIVYTILDDDTFIDGFSQRRFIGGDPNPLGPEIELRPTPDGGPADSASCMMTWKNGLRIHGLCINGFRSSAVSVSSTSDSTFARDTEIIGCYLGVDPTGSYVERYTSTAIGASHASGLRIGGDRLDERVIAVAEIHDIWLAECRDVSVINSYFGVDRTGTVALAYPWFDGISIGKPQGPILIRDCVIGGSRSDQVHIGAQYDEPGTVTLLRNRIGVGVDGTPMGAYSYGIYVIQCGGHVIRENILAHVQSWYEIELFGDDTDYVTISRNSIYACHRLGINLCHSTLEIEAATGVDYADGQYGPRVNEEIDPCLCDSVTNISDGQGGTTTAYFTCMKECTVEVFVGDEEGSNLACSMGGSYGRVYSGRTYLGDAEEVSQGPVFSTYRLSVSPGLPVGMHLTATATNRNGSTSEFGCSGIVPYPGQTAEGCAGAGDGFMVEGPNPGVGEFVLRCRLARPGRVEITVYTLAGELAARVMEGFEEAGEHVMRWQPRDERGEPLPSGAYVVRLATDRSVYSAKAVVLR